QAPTKDRETMRKVILALAAATMLSAAPVTALASYADDRAEIENLTARYLIALDAGDLETYANTFTEDGVLEWAGPTEHGRAEIKKGLENFGTGRTPLPANATDRPRTIRTILTHRIDVTGDTATAVAMWVGFTNENLDKRHEAFEFGHYEDELVKVNGHWLFKKRHIFNERGKNKALFYPALGETDPRIPRK
ncbi:MAG: nuclear transport factor 2 family protein, partial [Caulobacteraceae bacterium]